jgi:hypothetical protein
MLALAADYDAGHISLMRMDRRAASIRDDYRRACDCLKDRQPISYDWAPSPIPEHP